MEEYIAVMPALSKLYQFALYVGSGCDLGMKPTMESDIVPMLVLSLYCLSVQFVESRYAMVSNQKTENTTAPKNAMNVYCRDAKFVENQSVKVGWMIRGITTVQKFAMRQLCLFVMNAENL